MENRKDDIDKLLNGLESLIDSKQSQHEKLLDFLSKKRDSAIENDFGFNERYVEMLTKSIGNLKDAMDTQKEAVKSFYNQMVKLAGGKSSLDPEELKDILDFQVKYLALTKQIEENSKRKSAEERKKNPNTVEINRFERNINDLKNSIIALKANLLIKYKTGSLAAKQMSSFTYGDETVEDISGYSEDEKKEAIKAKRKRRKLQRAIDASEKAEATNLREIKKAEEENNEELEKTREKWNAIKVGVKAVYSQIRTGAQYWLKYNEQAISDAKRLGITSKEAAMGYMNTLMENSKALSRNFGMTAEQAMKLQDTYAKVTGRAALLTQSQMEDIAASSKLMGDETVQSAIKMMDSIGTTSQSTTELLDRNFARAVNSGLDTVKASEEFVKNMSLANRLTFRDGVDGISKMTIMSQTIKMNLQEVANVAEKFSTIEGAIEGAAQLQMLGGPVAMFGSNPMQMLQESLADPEALFTRMKDMAGTQAVFNRRTGEAEIDPMTLAFMKEQEKALGMSPGTLIGSAKQQAKIREIESDWRRYQPSAFQTASPEAKAAIANKAEYDKETGTWLVKYLDERGEEQTVGLNELTEKHLEAITKDNIEPVEDIRTQVRKIAGELIGTKERWNSLKDQFRTSVGQLIGPFMKLGDLALTTINSSSAWRIATDAGFGTIGALAGYGMYKGVSAWLAPKAGRLVRGLFTSGGKGGVAGSLTNHSESFLANTGSSVNGGSVGSNNVSSLSRIKPWGQLSRAGKIARGGGAALAVIGGALVGIDEYSKASGKLESAYKAIDIAEMGGGYRRYGNDEIKRMRTAARNRASEERAGAIGAGVGTAAGGLAGFAAGAAAGAAIGTFIPIPVVGTLVGAAVGALGGYLGGKYGKKVGRSMASREDDDVINRHLNEINKGDEEDNIRKIVLPVESIDYNVSLIANRMGVISASPARGNIYLEAEAMGEKTVEIEGHPITADHVNQVDTHIVNASQIYQPSGPLSLNIGGSIDLNLKGANIGKLTGNDFMKMLNDNPYVMMELTEAIKTQIFKNGNACRFTKEYNLQYTDQSEKVSGLGGGRV